MWLGYCGVNSNLFHFSPLFVFACFQQHKAWFISNFLTNLAEFAVVSLGGLIRESRLPPIGLPWEVALFHCRPCSMAFSLRKPSPRVDCQRVRQMALNLPSVQRLSARDPRQPRIDTRLHESHEQHGKHPETLSRQLSELIKSQSASFPRSLRKVHLMNINCAESFPPPRSARTKTLRSRRGEIIP